MIFTTLHQLLLLLLICHLALSFAQLYDADPITREQFQASFDGPEGKDFFKKFLSAAQLFTRDFDDLENTQLVPVLQCLIYLREYGKGLMVKQCAKKFSEYPLIDKRIQHFLLAYRCFRTANPYDYELHTATIDKIKLTTEGWTVSFRPQEAYYCRVRWTVEESVKSTMNYLKDQGLVERRPEVYNEPLTMERFEETFDYLKREFHMYPFFSYIFTRDLRTEEKQWTEVKQCFVNLSGIGRGLITSRCANIIREYQMVDAAMPNLVLAYRCFKSDNPYDYDLHTAPILNFFREHDYAANAIVLFKPIEADHCCTKYMGNRPIDTLMFADYLNDSRAVDNARVARAEPLTREQFEAAFPLNEGFQSRPFLSYVFVKDLETGARQLMPIRKCLVLLYGPGKGIISMNCAEILGHYYHVSSRSLAHLLFLPFRCFLYSNPDSYELHNVTISSISMEFGQYILSFTHIEAKHCAPVWARDHRHRKELNDPLEDNAFIYLQHDEL